MPASRQRISVLTPFCCAPGRPLASPLSQDRQECKDTCAFSLSPTPKAHSLGPAGPIPEPTLRALPSLQPAGAPRVPPGQAPPQPLAFHSGLSPAPPAARPRLFPALPAPHSSPELSLGAPSLSPLTQGCHQSPLSPGCPRRPRSPCPGTSRWWCRAARAPPFVPVAQPLCPAPGAALWCGRKRRGRERKRRGAGERRWRHRLGRGRERCGILRGVAGAGPLQREGRCGSGSFAGEGGVPAGGAAGPCPRDAVPW